MLPSPDVSGFGKSRTSAAMTISKVSWPVVDTE